MSYKVKYRSIKSQAYFFFDDIINIKNFDLNNFKIHEKSYKNIVIYCIKYMTIKDSKYVKINSVNTFYVVINNVNVTLKKLIKVNIYC